MKMVSSISLFDREVTTSYRIEQPISKKNKMTPRGEKTRDKKIKKRKPRSQSQT
jgi:hypothetical protein